MHRSKAAAAENRCAARTFDIGTAPHRQALDQSVFDASVRELDLASKSVIDSARKGFDKPDRWIMALWIMIIACGLGRTFR